MQKFMSTFSSQRINYAFMAVHLISFCARHWGSREAKKTMQRETYEDGKNFAGNDIFFSASLASHQINCIMYSLYTMAIARQCDSDSHNVTAVVAAAVLKL